MIIELLIISNLVLVKDNGQYQNVDPAIRSWFKSIQSPNGVSCCDISDGHYTTTRAGSNGGYEVQIDGKWFPVPKEAVINNSKNPTGEPVVWYTKYKDGSIYIRCFTSGIDG